MPSSESSSSIRHREGMPSVLNRIPARQTRLIWRRKAFLLVSLCCHRKKLSPQLFGFCLCKAMSRVHPDMRSIGRRDLWSRCARSAGACPPRKNAPAYRSAGACPPRSLECANAAIDPGMARDRPSPYGEGCRLFTVARGTGPREAAMAPGMARDRPSPYDEGMPFFHRSAGALGCHTRIRAGFPREAAIDPGMARDRPSPYGKACRFYRSAGACPPRSLGRADAGEGQALALR